MRSISYPLIRDYVQLTLGSLCVAVALDAFLIPNDILVGGVTGIAQILNSQFGLPVGAISLVLNIPLFILGIRYLGGWAFGARTIYATVVLSLAIDLLAAPLKPYVVTDPLLYTFYGGLLGGLGLGLVFRARGTTGGADILARFLSRWRGVKLGQAVLALEVAVFAAGGWLYGPKAVLYAVLVAFITGRVVDVVLEGLSLARSALIMSKQPDAVREALLHQLGRGVTVLPGLGGFTAAQQPVLLCVVAQSEISTLKALVSQIDPTAFVVITEAVEVLGEGFRAVINE